MLLIVAQPFVLPTSGALLPMQAAFFAVFLASKVMRQFWYDTHGVAPFSVWAVDQAALADAVGVVVLSVLGHLLLWYQEWVAEVTPYLACWVVVVGFIKAYR